MKHLVVALVAAQALLTPAAAASPDAARTPTARGRVVEIRVRGDAATLAQVRLTAEELLARLDVVPVVEGDEQAEPESEPGRPPRLVLARLDFLVPTSPRIEIEDGQTHEELTRRTLAEVPSLEAGVESVLHVLYLAVESRLQVTNEPPPSPPKVDKPRPPPPSPKRAAPSRFGLDLGPLLRLSALDQRRVVPGGGLALEPHQGFGSVQVGLAFSGALHGTTELRFKSGSADLQPLQLRLVPMADVRFSRDVSARLGLGGGLDALMVRPVEAPAVGLARPPQSALDPIVTATLGARVRLSGRTSLAALGSLDLDLAPTSFVVRDGPRNEGLLALARLRGGFSLAFDFTLLGERRFGKGGLEP